ncbi:T9SS type B sorting domain-containing protein, partial [Polluticaenibacter yanchengensis]|nr:gliding motility-associated C-terminal domain-containing protein [Chitinophagaceae bacterium LY-5]
VYTTTNMEHVFTDIKDYPVKLKAVTTYGCEAELTKTLNKTVFLSGPDIAFTASDINPCQNSTIELKSSVLNSVVVKSWQWDFGNGTTSTQANPSVRYTRSGTYTITLKATDEIGCVTNIPVSQEIRVQVLPVISAGKDRVVEFGTTIQLEGTTGNNLSEISLLWTPAGLLNNPAILTPSYLANGEQTFILTATNKDGNCEVTDDVLIRVQRTVSKVPNAFSPNGDGINDYWVIENLSDYPYCKVQVFSRQGQLVYSSIGYSRPWDGTKNGKPLPVGTYYYIITVKDGEPPLQGSVTLLR